MGWKASVSLRSLLFTHIKNDVKFDQCSAHGLTSNTKNSLVDIPPLGLKNICTEAYQKNKTGPKAQEVNHCKVWAYQITIAPIMFQ